jgi:hypothetical protein
VESDVEIGVDFSVSASLFMSGIYKICKCMKKAVYLRRCWKGKDCVPFICETNDLFDGVEPLKM